MTFLQSQSCNLARSIIEPYTNEISEKIQHLLENSDQTVFFIESNVFPLLRVKLKNV